MKTKSLFITLIAFTIGMAFLFYLHSTHQRNSALETEEISAVESADRDPSSEGRKPTVANKIYSYKIEDGYGRYAGVGKTKLEASSQARKSCIMQKVLAFEAKHGVTPNEDTADLFFDACINK